MSIDDDKRTVGRAAARLVEDGMIVGLGTGSTAAHMVRALGVRAAAEGLQLRVVASSEATAELARICGLQLMDLDEAVEIDLTLDGADEIGPRLALIKGGGAALLREKLVWRASRRCMAIADASKVVNRLGAFPLPVEVVAFGHGVTARRIELAMRDAGFDAPAILRVRDGAAVLTDGGHVIYDFHCEEIAEPEVLGATLKAVTGVVDHGLFLGLCACALVASDGTVSELRP